MAFVLLSAVFGYVVLPAQYFQVAQVQPLPPFMCILPVMNVQGMSSAANSTPFPAEQEFDLPGKSPVRCP